MGEILKILKNCDTFLLYQANAIGITLKINSRSEKTGEESSLSYSEGHPVEGTCLILSSVDWKVGHRIQDTEIIQGYPQRMGLQRRFNGI